MKLSILTLCLALPFLMAPDCGYHGGGQGYSDDAGSKSFDLMQYMPGCDVLWNDVVGCGSDFQDVTVRNCVQGKLQNAETGLQNSKWRYNAIDLYEEIQTKMALWIERHTGTTCVQQSGTIFNGLYKVTMTLNTFCQTEVELRDITTYAQLEINQCWLN